MTLTQRLSVLMLSSSLMAASCITGIEIEIPDLCFDNSLSIDPLDSNVSSSTLQAAADIWADGVGGNVFYVTPFRPAEITVLEVPTMPAGREDKIGLAYARFDPNTGEVISCDILLKRGAWSTRVLAHELGHCAGLGHDDSERHPRSLMLSAVPYDYVIYPHHIMHMRQCPLRNSAFEPDDVLNQQSSDGSPDGSSQDGDQS